MEEQEGHAEELKPSEQPRVVGVHDKVDGQPAQARPHGGNPLAFAWREPKQKGQQQQASHEQKQEGKQEGEAPASQQQAGSRQGAGLKKHLQQQEEEDVLGFPPVAREDREDLLWQDMGGRAVVNRAGTRADFAGRG